MKIPVINFRQQLRRVDNASFLLRKGIITATVQKVLGVIAGNQILIDLSIRYRNQKLNIERIFVQEKSKIKK